MVRIRLSRHGAKKHPFYHLVVADIDACRDGKFLEHVGTYDPTLDRIKIELDRVDHWLGVGAKATPRANTIINAFRRQAAAAAAAPA